MMNRGNNCCERYKYRDEEEKQALIKRLNRIEGQIRGIRSMVENDRYCADVITQVAAANAALDSFNRELLSSHINSCVVNDIKNEKEDAVDELITLLKKIMK
ncbi:MAG: metal-sensing transcriptional repressor [Ruminococcaceae bacterium]|nr:metal-sensing transcriptional repressor [Oscillospiraceae bacterium]